MFLLKFMAIALITVQVALSKKMRQDAVDLFGKMTEPYLESCLQEANLTQDDIKPLFDAVPIPESEGINCFFKCVYQNFGMVDSNGDPILANLVVEEAKYFTSEIATKCAKEASLGTTPCKKSYILANCVVEALAV